MKKPTLILFLALSFMFCGKAFAQAPLMFNYQAVLRDAGGQLLINQQVQIRISILQNSSFGPVVYNETHTPTTNDNGLIAILVGSGTPINGNISAINWGNGSYYLKSEVDPTGGTNYTLTSTQQLLSVPYALFSNGGDYTNLINKPDIPDIVNSYFESHHLADTIYVMNIGHDTIYTYVHDTVFTHTFDTVHTYHQDTLHTYHFDTTFAHTFDTIHTYHQDTLNTYHFDTVFTHTFDTVHTYHQDTLNTYHFDTTFAHTFDTIHTYHQDTLHTYHFDTVFAHTYDTIHTYHQDTLHTYHLDTVFAHTYDTIHTYHQDTLHTYHLDTVFAHTYDTIHTYHQDTLHTYHLDTTFTHSFDTIHTYHQDTLHTYHFDTIYNRTYDTTYTHSIDTVHEFCIDTAYIDSVFANYHEGLPEVVAISNSAANHQIKDIENPTEPMDAVNKRYFDSVLTFVCNRYDSILGVFQHRIDSLDMVIDSLTQCVTTHSIDYQTACDYYTWMDGITYTASTTIPTFTTTNIAGCDSVITLHLTINHGTHTSESATASTCYTWHDTTYTTSGTYTYNYIDANGCSSTDTLHLSIDTNITLSTPFYVEDVSGSTNTMHIAKNSTGAPTVTLDYSYDGSTWTTWGTTSTTALSLNIPANSRVYLRANATQIAYDVTRYNTISADGDFNVGGNIHSLLQKNSYDTISKLSQGFNFAFLFQDASHLKSASQLLLPATILSRYCYQSMFKNCSALTTPPQLPATTLTSECYRGMFSNCSSLTEAPTLPATTLADICYYGMFYGCTSLTTAPDLPATTLTTECYAQMFQGCTSLIQPPLLPATTLAFLCYSYMFRNCTSLTIAPELPATTLTESCYSDMFYGCSNLHYIKVAFTDWNTAQYCTSFWTKGVPATGTFVCPSGLPHTMNEPGNNSFPNYIPYNWTIEDASATDDSSTAFFIKDVSGSSNTLHIVKTSTSAPTITLEYSYDGANWSTWGPTSSTPLTLTIPANNKVYLRADATRYATNHNIYNRIYADNNFEVGGNICSLLQKNSFDTITSLSSEWTFAGIFSAASHLTSAERLTLPATILSKACYWYMFSSCSSLTEVPLLPATTLAKHCYTSMFSFCSSLTTAPVLPATTLVDSCYYRMFGDCTSLTTAPALPATTLAKACYMCMFDHCTSLASAPALPATTLANGCYQQMFSRNTSLTTVPALPATTLADYCYYNMFSYCSALTEAPELPATSLASQCYCAMFANCTSLINAPALPASTLAENCYGAMFDGCTSLTNAPALPATTLASHCYSGMFYNCTSLTIAPELPATTLTEDCYLNMFSGCSNLHYIKVHFTDWNTNQRSTSSWTRGLPATGTFVCPTDLPHTMNTAGNNSNTNYIPYNWTIEGTAASVSLSTPFYIEDASGSTNTLHISKNSTGAPTVTLDYSFDGSIWTTWGTTSTSSLSLNIPPNGRVYLRANATRYAIDGNNYNHIYTTADFHVGGNIHSLLQKNNFDTITILPNSHTFLQLFQNANHLTSSDQLSLPATTLSNSCYLGMFYNCAAMTSAPLLPSTSLASYCYSRMFEYCSSLTEAPTLPATLLANDCYEYMFSDCISLTEAPVLPATIMRNSCYSSMFSGCTSLTQAPDLPATTLATQCYSNMFSDCPITTPPALPATTLATGCYEAMFLDCSALTQAPELPATTLAHSCYTSMFRGCTSLTQAPELPATTLAEYCYWKMFENCSSLTVAPELPATSLERYCYNRMFYGCSNLHYIKVSFTHWVTTAPTSTTNDWTYDLPASGTFICPNSLTRTKNDYGNTYHAHYIPYNWTISTY